MGRESGTAKAEVARYGVRSFVSKGPIVSSGRGQFAKISYRRSPRAGREKITLSLYFLYPIRHVHLCVISVQKCRSITEKEGWFLPLNALGSGLKSSSRDEGTKLT